MSKNRLLQLVAVAVMLMGLAASGLAMKTARAAGTGEEFQGSVSGTVSLIDETHFALVGTGRVSQMGKLRNYQGDGVFTGPNTDTLIETLTAANGDQLIIRCDQVLAKISPGVYRGTDTWIVIGGTGRFSGATGSGTGETVVNLNTGTFTKEMNGVISMPDNQ